MHQDQPTAQCRLSPEQAYSEGASYSQGGERCAGEANTLYSRLALRYPLSLWADLSMQSFPPDHRCWSREQVDQQCQRHSAVSVPWDQRVQGAHAAQEGKATSRSSEDERGFLVLQQLGREARPLHSESQVQSKVCSAITAIDGEQVSHVSKLDRSRRSFLDLAGQAFTRRPSFFHFLYDSRFTTWA